MSGFGSQVGYHTKRKNVKVQPVDGLWKCDGLLVKLVTVKTMLGPFKGAALCQFMDTLELNKKHKELKEINKISQLIFYSVMPKYAYTIGVHLRSEHFVSTKPVTIIFTYYFHTPKCKD